MGFMAAEMPPVSGPLPLHDTAVMDGWAFRALDLTGASAYAPVPLRAAPVWVEAGNAMPEGCDCVLEADLVDSSGAMAQAFAEAVPGKGIRRAGTDMGAGNPPVLPGRRLSALDLLVLRSAGLDEAAVRVPRLRMIDIAATDGGGLTARLMLENVAAAGAAVTGIETAGRVAGSIAKALDGAACDSILLIGGTGGGHRDATAEALAARGALIAHEIALEPGRTAAVGRLGKVPVIALPGAPDQALAGFLTLVLPVLDRLAGRVERRGALLPLARKIASGVGIAELVLLSREPSAWKPIAVGALSLDQMRMADAWLVVPGDSEGYAAGTPVEAFPLRDCR